MSIKALLSVILAWATTIGMIVAPKITALVLMVPLSIIISIILYFMFKDLFEEFL